MNPMKTKTLIFFIFFTFVTQCFSQSKLKLTADLNFRLTEYGRNDIYLSQVTLFSTSQFSIPKTRSIGGGISLGYKWIYLTINETVKNSTLMQFITMKERNIPYTLNIQNFSHKINHLETNIFLETRFPILKKLNLGLGFGLTHNLGFKKDNMIFTKDTLLPYVSVEFSPSNQLMGYFQCALFYEVKENFTMYLKYIYSGMTGAYKIGYFDNYNNSLYYQYPKSEYGWVTHNLAIGLQFNLLKEK